VFHAPLLAARSIAGHLAKDVQHRLNHSAKKFFFSENPFATPIRLSIAERWRRDSSFAARFRSQGIEEDRNEIAHVCWFAEQP
jgi:hypothetical protein